MYLKTADMENRLRRVEQQVDNQGLVTLLQKLEAIERDVQGLRNDVETMQYQVEQAGGRQRDLYLDLDRRLQAMEQNVARASGAADLGRHRG